VHNKQFIKITFHLAGQTSDSFALMRCERREKVSTVSTQHVQH